MNSRQIIDNLKAKKELPTPPGVALQLLQLLQGETANAQEIANVLECDPVLTARILRYANSPLVGASGDISSLTRAIALLGLRRVAVLSLSYFFVNTDSGGSTPALDCEAFWQRSIARGVVARQLAKLNSPHEADEAFVGGLIGDMGLLLMSTCYSDEYKEILPDTCTRAELHKAELDAFGVTSDEVGISLLEEWNFPAVFISDLVEANGITAGENPTSQRLRPRCLSVAKLTSEAMVHSHENVSLELLDAIVDQVNRCLGISQDEWERIFDECVQEWKTQCEVLEIASHDVKSFGEIEREAREQLAVLSIAAVTESEAMYARATTDGLTGIANRSTLDDRLQLEVERFRRDGGDLLVLMIDVDHFKAFNDTHGHQLGDIVLKRVAEALEANIRRVDMAARYGGEEFIVVAPQCSRDHAQMIADRLRRAVQDLRIEHEGKVLKVTVSVGGAYARMIGAAEAIAAEMIGRADAQLYRSKAQGRNRANVDPSDLPTPTNVRPIVDESTIQQSV